MYSGHNVLINLTVGIRKKLTQNGHTFVRFLPDEYEEDGSGLEDFKELKYCEMGSMTLTSEHCFRRCNCINYTFWSSG